MAWRDTKGDLAACSGLTAGRLALHCYMWSGIVEVLTGGWLLSGTSAAALLNGSK